jgi:pyruvate formate lyase activating enzyme
METILYEKIKDQDQSVRCGICNHFCLIREGKRGICRVRENRGGKLICLVYPRIIAQSVDPIEKKPIFHFKPGSFSYSVATVGCNFKCAFCQNDSIAHSLTEHMPADMKGPVAGNLIYPEDIVAQALKTGCQSISYTYTEPTVFFELALDTAKLAKEKGLSNIFVTNGYMSEKALRMVSPYLDAANVDLKAFSDDFYKTYCKATLNPVKDNIRLMRKLGIMVEVTTLLIPGLNDDKQEVKALAEFISHEIGPETPWHVSRFHPCYQMQDRPATPISSIMTACEAGKNAGLRYVYAGNVPGQGYENTVCHVCGTVLVKRYGYQTDNYLTPGGLCPECNSAVYGVY